MSEDLLEDRLEEALPALSGLRALVCFDLGAEGKRFLDARSAPARLIADEGDPVDCTIAISKDNLGKLLDGKLDPMLGWTLGKIKVTGSLGIAMKLVGALG